MNEDFWFDVIICALGLIAGMLLTVYATPPIRIWPHDIGVMTQACGNMPTHHAEITRREIAAQCADGTWRRYVKQ